MNDNRNAVLGVFVAEIVANDTAIKVRQFSPLTAGLVGAYVIPYFGPEMDAMDQKQITFVTRQGSETVKNVKSGEPVVIPAGILSTSGFEVEVGACCYNSTRSPLDYAKEYIPTTLASLGRCHKSPANTRRE